MAEQNNPYSAPSAPVADITQAVDDGRLIEGGQSVPSGHGWQWIVDGFNLFKLNPGIWIVNLIILFVILFVLAFIPFLGALATYILFPIFSGGLMLGCHALMHNEPLEVGHLFAGFREKAGPLAVVGLLYLVGLIVILGIAGVFVGFGVVAAMFSGVLPAAGAAGAAGELELTRPERRCRGMRYRSTPRGSDPRPASPGRAGSRR